MSDGIDSTTLSLLRASFVACFALLILFFIFAADGNADEGFYLVASKLVYQGKLLYRDFHYTQMPLLPYVYGVPQLIFGNSLYVGRLTSVLLLVLSVVVMVKTARLLAGKGSVIWIALLLGTNWWFIYLGTITKTHALVYLLVALSVYVCAKEIYVPPEQAQTTKRARLLILGTVFAGTAVLARLPSLGFAAVLFGYTSFRTAHLGRRWLALNVLGAVGVGAVAVAFAMAAGWNVFWFNTVGFHLLNSGDGIPAGTGPLRSAVWALNAISRVKELMGTYNSVFPLELLVISFAIVLYTWSSERRSGVSVDKQKSQLMLAIALGTFVLAVSPFVQNPGQADYSVISFPSAALVIASAFGTFTSGSPVGPVSAHKAKPASWMLVLFVFVSGYHFLRYSVPTVDEVGILRVNGVVKLPLNYLREVAFVLTDNRKADGLVLTTYGYLAHEAGLPLMAGLEMAGFSCQELPRSLTERYKIVNIESLTSMIASSRAEYIIVSRGRELMDFARCKWTPKATALAKQHLERYYHALAEFDDVGEQRDDIVIYQRRANGEE